MSDLAWKKWPGGTGVVTVIGEFLHAEGVGTQLQLHHRSRRLTDGVLDAAIVLQTFAAPGSYTLNVPPGVYAFGASGPHGLAWHVSAKLDLLPKPTKAPTLADRIEALEARAGKRGLDS